MKLANVVAYAVLGAILVGASPAQAVNDKDPCYPGLQILFGLKVLKEFDGGDGLGLLVDARHWLSLNAEDRFDLLRCINRVIAGSGNSLAKLTLYSSRSGRPVARIVMGKPEIVD